MDTYAKTPNIGEPTDQGPSAGQSGQPSVQGGTRSEANRLNWLRLPKWLTSSEDARKLTVNALTIAVAGLVVAVLTNAVIKRSYVISSISLPKKLEERGYTGTVVAQRIIDEIQQINSTSTTSRSRDPFSSATSESRLPNIQLPVGGISLESFASELKGLFHNSDIQITGEITVDDAHETPDQKPSTKYRLRLRISQNSAMVSEAVPIEKIDLLFEQAAILITQKINPYLAASYFSAMRRPDQVERMIELCLKEGDKEIRPWALNMRGLLAYDRKDYARAVHEYESVNEHFPKFSLSRYNLAQVLITQATNLRNEALGFDDSAKIRQLNNQARDLLIRAKNVASEGIRVDKNERSLAIGHNNAGLALLQLAESYDRSKYDEAHKFFADSVKLDSTYVTAHINLGSLLRDRVPSKIDLAIDSFRRATELAPKSPQAYSEWGLALRKDRRHAEAIEKFEKARQLDPNSTTPHLFIGLYRLDEGDLSAAEGMFRKAIEINPRWHTYYFHLGRVLHEAGKTDSAIESFEKAVALYPTNSRYNVYLGSTLTTASRQQKGAVEVQLAKKARARLEKAFSLGSGDDEILEMAQRAIAMLDAPRTKGGVTEIAGESAGSEQDVLTAPNDPSIVGTRIK